MMSRKFLLIATLLASFVSLSGQEARVDGKFSISAGPGLAWDAEQNRTSTVIEFSPRYSYGCTFSNQTLGAKLPWVLSFAVMQQGWADSDGGDAYFLALGGGLYFKSSLSFQIKASTVGDHLYLGLELSKEHEVTEEFSVFFGPSLATVLNDRDKIFFNLNVGINFYFYKIN